MVIILTYCCNYASNAHSMANCRIMFLSFSSISAYVCNVCIMRSLDSIFAFGALDIACLFIAYATAVIISFSVFPYSSPSLIMFSFEYRPHCVSRLDVVQGD